MLHGFCSETIWHVGLAFQRRMSCNIIIIVFFNKHVQRHSPMKQTRAAVVAARHHQHRPTDALAALPLTRSAGPPEWNFIERTATNQARPGRTGQLSTTIAQRQRSRLAAPSAIGPASRSRPLAHSLARFQPAPDRRRRSSATTRSR